MWQADARLRDDYGDIGPEQLFEWTKAQVPDSADVVVIGGGGFRAIGAIQALEQSLARPVLSANQAAFWQAIRVAGVDDGIAGYGGLFGIGGT